MDENDAAGAGLGGSGQANALAADRDGSAVILKESSEHAHQRRLTRSVLADKGVHFTGEKIEIHRIDRPCCPEHLGDRPQAHDWPQDLTRRRLIAWRGGQRAHEARPPRVIVRISVSEPAGPAGRPLGHMLHKAQELSTTFW